jgi:transcriptional regulator with XRE-family HTH domain
MAHALRKYRHEAGKSLQEVAERSKTTRATLSRIENGLQIPSLDLVKRIIEATHGAVTANDFLPSHKPDEAA